MNSLELFSEEKLERTLKLDGNEYTFYFREPNTEEKLGYMASSVKKTNGKINIDSAHLMNIRFEYGKKCLTGFPEKHDNGIPQFVFKDKPISSDPKSENFLPEWKDILAGKFITGIIRVALELYDGIKQETFDELVKKNEADLTASLEEADENAPLESSSSPH